MSLFIEHSNKINFDTFKVKYDSLIEKKINLHIPYLVRDLDKLVRLSIKRLKIHNKQEDILKILNYDLKKKAELKVLINLYVVDSDSDSNSDSGYDTEYWYTSDSSYESGEEFNGY